MRTKHYIYLTLNILLAASCVGKNPVLEVAGGKICGVPSQEKGVTVFRGIPYAAPPVGELRWKAPQPAPAWEGIKVCDTFSAMGWQTLEKPGEFYGDEFYWEGVPDCSEDCLYLNVWAPSASLGDPGAKLPVALWIHGGAYNHGYGHEVTMDGDAWAKRGVILVTINYRLGIFGFLSHPELTKEQGQSGNYGTMDQIYALQWVKNNISVFGGDPGNIKIFGQSAGANSVSMLMISPLSRDLISGAIIQSGGGLDSRTRNTASVISQEEYDAQGKEMMDVLGLRSLDEMRAASAEEIFEAASTYTGRVRLGPHIDGKVLTEDFSEALYNGTMAQVPVIIGNTLNDLPRLATGKLADNFSAVADSLGRKVWQYRFVRNLPGDDEDPAKDAGAFHSSELWYVFGTLDKSWRPFTEADYSLSARMLDAWTTFCKTGDPGWPASTIERPYTEVFNIE